MTQGRAVCVNAEGCCAMSVTKQLSSLLSTVMATVGYGVPITSPLPKTLHALNSSSYNATNPCPSKHKPTQCLSEQSAAKPNLPPRARPLIPTRLLILVQSPAPRTPGKISLRRGLREEEVEQQRD